MTRRVLVADDQELVRTGFRLILTSDPGIEVVGEAVDGEQAVALTKELTPDVVLMDIRMPEIDGIEATRRIVRDVSAPPRILILTTFDLDEYVYDAIAAGASGFLLKDVPASQLISGVQTVATGDALLDPQITRRLIEEFSRSRTPIEPPAGFAELTAREHEVFKLLAQGNSNGEIAAKLFLEETTIKTHVTRILSKLQVRDRVQAVILAYEAGLIAPGRG
jgi:DNA-binding NarL/FixJ family response regulator